MSNKVKVASIKIVYQDGDEKEMSVDDAKALLKQLQEIFGQSNSNVREVIIERDRWPWWYQPKWETGGYATTSTGTVPMFNDGAKVMCSAEGS